MNRMNTLRSKLLFGFIAVIVPLAFALYFLNYYSIKVVRDEVSHSTTNLLELHVSQIDSGLEKVSQYLLRFSTSDIYYPDLVGLTVYPQQSKDYFFAKQRIFNEIQEELSSNNMVDTFFAYSKKYDDLIATQRSYQSSVEISKLLHSFIQDDEMANMRSWQIVQAADEFYLLQIEQIHPNVFVGALINTESLMIPMQSVDLGTSGRAMLLSSDAQPLTATDLDETSMLTIADKLNGKNDYSIYTDPRKDVNYLLVDSPFARAPVTLAVIIPEKDLLQKLLYFQRALVIIPIGIVVLLIGFSFVLKKVLHEPLSTLIRAMRRMSQGDFEVRLDKGDSAEITFLNDTFNKMVSEIRTLKINVYEEMLRTQEAEFRHLQAQINPHFYLNSLNIVYSLSLLKRNDLVEKMTMHLADYFRFIMGADREVIPLELEIEHIRNYLEIQQLRFPNKLKYEIILPEDYKNREIFPLMIQPFVENAVIHGMKKLKGTFYIYISIRQAPDDPGMLEVDIVDNGGGFPAETLRNLQDGQPLSDSPTRNLGIRNVRNRLKLRFGDAVSIIFRNRQNGNDGGSETGAEVILRIPLE